jgi:hypothetical protein
MMGKGLLSKTTNATVRPSADGTTPEKRREPSRLQNETEEVDQPTR